MISQKTINQNSTAVKVTSLLVQDPARNCAYNVPYSDLENYVTKDWTNVDEGTVTFIMANDELFNELAELSPVTPSKELSVLIQDPANSSSYYLGSDVLKTYKCSMPKSWDEIPQGVATFVVPKNDLFEEMPALRRGLLQNNTPAPTM